MEILIVDDNQDNKMTIELLLEEFENLNIDEASDGEEALNKCKNKKYDLVFMDIMMPKMDGITATKEIRKFDKKVMIIAISALDEEKSKEEMIINGAEDFITKPIDSRLFIKRVENYLEILKYRGTKSYDYEAINLFNKEVYNKSVIFRVFDNSSLSYFWEYFLSDEDKKVYKLSEGIRVLYALGAWLIKKGGKFTFIDEESDDCRYITQTELKEIEHIVKKLLIKHFDSNAFLIKDGVLSIKMNKIKPQTDAHKKEFIKIDSEKEAVLRQSFSEKITAKQFVKSSAIDLMDKIESLEDLEDRLDKELFSLENKKPTIDVYMLLADGFEEYNELIRLLIEFQSIVFALSSLVEFLRTIDKYNLNEKNEKKIILLLTNILLDLSNWRKTIFIEQQTNDIHYLDSSLLSSCLQIEMIVKEKEIEQEDDLELF